MKAFATWCVRHRLIVVLLWLAALIGTTALSQAVGTAYSNSFSLPNTESTHALSLLQAAAPKVAGDQEQIVFRATNGTKVTDPAVQATIDAMLAKVAAVPHVSAITSPYGPLGAAQISSDGTTAFATVTFDTQAQNISIPSAQRFVAAAQTARGPDLQIAVAGQVAESADRPSFGGSLLGIILAWIVLLLVFGSSSPILLSARCVCGFAIG